MTGLESFVNLEDVSIPIEEHKLLEYELSPYCSLIHDYTDNRDYLYYIDLTTGDEYEEDININSTPTVNGSNIDVEDIKDFYMILKLK